MKSVSEDNNNGNDNDNNNDNNERTKEAIAMGFSTISTSTSTSSTTPEDEDNALQLQNADAGVGVDHGLDQNKDLNDDAPNNRNGSTSTSTSTFTTNHPPQEAGASLQSSLQRLPTPPPAAAAAAAASDTDPVDSQALMKEVEVDAVDIAAAADNNNNDNSNNDSNSNSNMARNHSSWASSDDGSSSMMMESGFEDEHDLDDDDDEEHDADDAADDDDAPQGTPPAPQKAMDRVRDSFQRRRTARLNKKTTNHSKSNSKDSLQQLEELEQQQQQQQQSLEQQQQQQQQHQISQHEQHPQHHPSRLRGVANISNTSTIAETETFDDDTVTGNWSLDEGDSSGDAAGEREHGRGRGHTDSAATGSGDANAGGGAAEQESGVHGQQHQQHHQQQVQLLLSREDIEICQRLDQAYDRALEERQVGYTARYNSVRQSACFAVGFCSLYLTLGTFFFMRQAGWDVADSLLFSIYTITTVGYGHLENPETPLFQLYTIFFIFIGIATLTIMVAQVYQCIALEASRAQHSRDNSEMARRGLDILKKSDANGNGSTSSNSDSTNSVAHRGGGGRGVQRSNSHDVMMEIHQPLYAIDIIFQWWERAKVFLRENEFGRGLSVLLPFAGLIAIGAAVIGPIEGWTVVESVYFAVVSLTTVGFGDYYPTRGASVWFCILWLPFSIGFMSLFLANVAAFYIRLSDKNIERIERHLRRRIQRAKEQAEKERESVFKRAMRGQAYNASTIEMGGQEANRSDEEGAEEGANARPGSDVKRRRGFNTVPMMDDPEAAASGTHERSGRHLFGSLESVAGLYDSRRERILRNSIIIESPSEPGDLRPRGSTMSSMKDILRTVHSNLNAAGGSTATFRASGPENEFLSIRSTKSVSHHSLRSDPIRKPSFALRVLVQERFSEIFATDIAGYQSSIEIKENTLSVTIDTLKGTADKWLIPRRARKAFRAVAFEALYFVGEHGLITRGADALYDLSPFEFHGLFSPLVAALGDAETMEGWLASTDILADVDLRRDPSRPSLAHVAGGGTGIGQRRVSGKNAERLQTAMDRPVRHADYAHGKRVTAGNAFANR